jgi:hypothetical protein
MTISLLRRKLHTDRFRLYFRREAVVGGSMQSTKRVYSFGMCAVLCTHVHALNNHYIFFHLTLIHNGSKLHYEEGWHVGWCTIFKYPVTKQPSPVASD